ncbi:MAG TPA: hypothetical protein VGG38_07835 [Acidimicrobiales bacterium]|jgi:uncharacterized membrane protein
MNQFRLYLQRHRKDERGATLIFVAVAMSLLLPFTLALSLEIGQDTVVNRSLQNSADAGALDGARYLNVSPDVVSTIAGEAAQRNYPGVSYSVQQGSWSSGAGFTSSTTCEATASCTAVKVTTAAGVKHLFEAGNSSLSKSSIATVSAQAGFSIGTYLASISTSQSATLNALLGALGTSVNLTAVGYEGLANTSVTVQQLITASAGVLTPSNALTTSLTGAQWDSFLTSAVTTAASGLSCGASPVPYPCTAETQLSTLSHSINASTSATLCQLVSVNGSSCAGGTLTASALDASINVLQTLTTEAELANGSNGLNLNTILNLGLAGATLTTSLVAPAKVAYGPVGTTAETSQVNVSIALDVLNLGVLDIPITAADGVATLAALPCNNNIMSSMTLDAYTTALSTSITLLGSPVGTVTANAAPNTALTYTTVPPTTATATAGTNPQTIGTTTPTLSISLGGLNLGALGLVGVLLEAVISGLVSTLDSGLGPVLQALGVNVGGAQVAALSANCSGVQLVG